MSPPRARWAIWSDRTGIHTVPTPISPEAWRELNRRHTIERTGDGNWAEIRDEEGRTAAVLVKVLTRKPDR